MKLKTKKMKPTYIKPMWLSALCVGAMLGACSNDAEQAPTIGTADETPSRIEFTISLPGGSGVLYPTRMIQSGYECKISRLDVFEFRDSLNDDGTPAMIYCNPLEKDVPIKLFVKYYSDDDLSFHKAQEPNQYTLSINKDKGNEHEKTKHYFYFFSNFEQDNMPQGYNSILESYSSYGESDPLSAGVNFFYAGGNSFETTVLRDGEDGALKISADRFYSNSDGSVEKYGMCMSGVATNNRHSAIGGEGDDTGIEIPDNGSVQCFVDMTRLAARVDLYSHAPNLVITDAVLHNTYPLASFFNDGKQERDWDDIINSESQIEHLAERMFSVSLNTDSDVTDRLYADGDDFAETQAQQQWNNVYDVDCGIHKAFYCFETPNSSYIEKNHRELTAYVEVKFQLEDGTTGHVDVPFTKTDEDGNTVGVDIVRNNLYRVVIGDGKRIVPGAEIKVSIEDVPWEVIDLPAIVD